MWMCEAATESLPDIWMWRKSPHTKHVVSIGLRLLNLCMKCQITSMIDYPIESGFNEVDTCFLITANPIESNESAIDEETINRMIMNGEDISELTNKSNISPFRTILFPNSSLICDAFIKLVDDNAERKEKGEKEIYPTINLNRFEEQAPEAYFRRYTKDGDTVKEGDWIIAEPGDEVLDGDELKRKVFRTLWVTSICKTVDGKDIPTENVVRKAARAWTNGLKTTAGSGYMITPCKMQLDVERKKYQAQQPKDTNQQSGDEALVNEFEKEQPINRRERRR